MQSLPGDTPGIPHAQGLYDPEYEHDACGVGYIVSIDGVKSHKVNWISYSKVVFYLTIAEHLKFVYTVKLSEPNLLSTKFVLVVDRCLICIG